MITRKSLRQANGEKGHFDREKFESLTDSDIDRMIAEDAELAPPTETLVPLLDLRDIRRKLGLTQAQLPKKLRITVATLRNWEHGQDQTNPACRRCCGFSTGSPSRRCAPSTNQREGRVDRPRVASLSREPSSKRPPDETAG